MHRFGFSECGVVIFLFTFVVGVKFVLRSGFGCLVFDVVLIVVVGGGEVNVVVVVVVIFGLRSCVVLEP